MASGFAIKIFFVRLHKFSPFRDTISTNGKAAFSMLKLWKNGRRQRLYEKGRKYPEIENYEKMEEIFV